MYSQLGNMVFDKQLGFTSLSDTLEISYAEHALINQVTVLQPTGRNPQEFSIAMFFHQRFCNVAEQLKTLDDAMTSYQVLPLLMGNGKLLGNFVITTREKTILESTDQGDIIAANVSVTVKEYVANALSNEQQEDKQKAFAVNKKSTANTNNNNKAPKSKSPIPSSCAKKISESRRWIMAHAEREKASFSLYQKSNDEGVASRLARQAKNHILQTIGECNKLLAMPDCLSKYAINNSLITNTKNACSNLNTAYDGLFALPGTKLVLAGAHNNFQFKVDDLCKALQAADKDAITRK